MRLPAAPDAKRSLTLASPPDPPDRVRVDARAGASSDRTRASRSEDIATALAAVVKFCEALQAEEPAVSPYLARKAVETAARSGKVVGHKADLNFGDCFAYAHARARGKALLFAGDDFTHTDVPSALLDPRPLR